MESTGEYLFETAGSGHADEYVSELHGVRMQLVRHISFVDCPGHDILMATMLNGAAVMDAAMLLIAANEPCPQPQTSEHLAAVEIMQLANILILQNKVDLVQQEDAAEQYNVIKNFVAGTVAGKAPVLPVSAQLGYNVDMVARFIYSRVPVPVRRFDATPRMIVIRSFDVNKPGECVEKLCGGVAGGSITQGVLRHGDAIEIRPGIITKDGKCTPITSTIVSLYAEKNELQYAVPGGLIGVGTNIDPTLTRADRLVGQVCVLQLVSARPVRARVCVCHARMTFNYPCHTCSQCHVLRYCGDIVILSMQRTRSYRLPGLLREQHALLHSHCVVCSFPHTLHSTGSWLTWRASRSVQGSRCQVSLAPSSAWPACRVWRQAGSSEQVGQRRVTHGEHWLYQHRCHRDQHQERHSQASPDPTCVHRAAREDCAVSQRG